MEVILLTFWCILLGAIDKTLPIRLGYFGNPQNKSKDWNTWTFWAKAAKTCLHHTAEEGIYPTPKSNFNGNMAMINDNMMPLSSVCGFINPWNPMNEYVYRYIMLYSPKQPNWLSIFHIRDHRFLVNRWNVWYREWCRWKSPSTTRDMMSFTMKFGGFPRDFQTNPHGCNTPWSKIFDVFFSNKIPST